MSVDGLVMIRQGVFAPIILVMVCEISFLTAVCQGSTVRSTPTSLIKGPQRDHRGSLLAGAGRLTRLPAIESNARIQNGGAIRLNARQCPSRGWVDSSPSICNRRHASNKPVGLLAPYWWLLNAGFKGGCRGLCW